MALKITIEEDLERTSDRDEDLEELNKQIVAMFNLVKALCKGDCIARIDALEKHILASSKRRKLVFVNHFFISVKDFVFDIIELSEEHHALLGGKDKAKKVR